MFIRKLNQNLPIQTHDFERVLNFQKNTNHTYNFFSFLIDREIIFKKTINQGGKIPKYIQKNS